MEESNEEENNLGTLEEESKRRRDKLLAWRNSFNKSNQGSINNHQESNDQQKENLPLPRPKFRNYNPEDENLAVNKAEPGKPAQVEDLIRDQLDAAKPQPIADEIDLANLAPRKIDWDLKRNISKKLDKLEKRTKRAMAELIRERLKEEQSEIKAIES